MCLGKGATMDCNSHNTGRRMANEWKATINFILTPRSHKLVEAVAERLLWVVDYASYYSKCMEGDTRVQTLSPETLIVVVLILYVGQCSFQHIHFLPARALYNLPCSAVVTAEVPERSHSSLSLSVGRSQIECQCKPITSERVKKAIKVCSESCKL